MGLKLKVDANGFPDLDRPSSYAVVKFLLPKIDFKGATFEGLRDNEEVQLVALRDWEGDDMGRAHRGGGGRIEGIARGSTVRFGGGLMGFFSR